MTDKREALKSMLNNLINDKTDQATMDLHSYITAKMQDVAGLSTQQAVEPDEGGISDDETTE